MSEITDRQQQQEALTHEEQQFMDSELYTYDEYSAPISISILATKLARQFEQIPSYVGRFSNGTETF